MSHGLAEDRRLHPPPAARSMSFMAKGPPNADPMNRNSCTPKWSSRQLVVGEGAPRVLNLHRASGSPPMRWLVMSDDTEVVL